MVLSDSIDNYYSEKGAEWEAEREKWISVTDDLPNVENDMVKVLGWDGIQVLHVNFFKHDDEIDGRFRVDCLKCFNEINTITHWQPLPTPPKTSK